MTISLNQARKLAELGVKRDAEKILAWSTNNKYELFITSEIEIPDLYCLPNVFPAYNAEELLGMMEGGYDINVCEEKTVQVAAWYDMYQGCEYFRAATLTEALCNKLIFDLENGVVTVEEVNK